MRLTWGDGVQRSEHRFEGVHASEMQTRVTLWIDELPAGLLEKNLVSAKAKWTVGGQATDVESGALRATLPSPDWLEQEGAGPVVLTETPAGLTAPCYVLVIKPKQTAFLELTVSISIAKGDAAQAEAARLRVLPAGGLAETGQERLERLLRELDVAALRAMLAPTAGDAADGHAEPSGGAAPESAHALEWALAKTGQSLVAWVAMGEDGDPARRAAVFELLLEIDAPVPQPTEPRADAPPTALHAVVARGDVELAARLLSRPAAFPVHALCDWRGRRCTTPLHLACERGDLRMAQLLLAHGAYPDWSGASGRAGGVTPLALAISSGNVELAKMLIVEKRTDVGLRTLDPGFSALALACRGPSGLPMVEMLLDVAAESALGALCHSARPTQPLQEALVAAAAHGLAPVIRTLVRMRADVRGHKHPDGRTLLLDAVEHAHIDAVVELLAAGANPSDGGPASTLSPLTAAACVLDASRSRQLVLLLRRAGADVHAPDRAMRTAVEYARRLQGSSRPGGDLAIAELEAPLAEPELPKNWCRAVDEALGGTPYYFHIVTKEVRWTLPPPELSGLVPAG